MPNAIDPPVSIAEINTLKGSNIQTTLQAQIDAIGSTITLDDGKIFIGNASNVPTDRSLSGDLTITNTGVATVPNASVIGKVLTGYVSGAGTVSATDTILQAVNKLNGNSAAKQPQLLPLQTALTTSVSVTADYPTFQDVTGLIQSFTTTRDGQFIQIELISSALLGVATTFLCLGYKIGAGADVALVEATCVTSSYANVSCGTKIPIPTAGTFSIQIRVAKAGSTCSILGVTSAPEAQSTFTVTVI